MRTDESSFGGVSRLWLETGAVYTVLVAMGTEEGEEVHMYTVHTHNTHTHIHTYIHTYIHTL